MIVKDLLDKLNPDSEVTIVHTDGRLSQGYVSDFIDRLAEDCDVISIAALDTASILIVVN